MNEPGSVHTDGNPKGCSGIGWLGSAAGAKVITLKKGAAT